MILPTGLSKDLLTGASPFMSSSSLHADACRTFRNQSAAVLSILLIGLDRIMAKGAKVKENGARPQV
jgi:hypothetical protein